MAEKVIIPDIAVFSNHIQPILQIQFPETILCIGTVNKLKPSGSFYHFELGDKECSIRCFVGREVAKTIKTRPQEGQTVTVAGTLDVYQKEGRLQIVVEAIADQDKPPATAYHTKELAQKITNQLEKLADQRQFVVNGEIFHPQYGGKMFELGNAETAIRCYSADTKYQGFEHIQSGKQVELGSTLGLYTKDCRLQLKPIAARPYTPTRQHLALQRLTKSNLLPRDTRPIPAVIERIGLIVGSGSQARQDFQQIYKREKGQAEVKESLVPVKGQNAPEKIAAAINQFSLQKSVDVIVITRGGGSGDELSEVFDDYTVAAAICQSHIPVITAIGHTDDHTLADDVADQTIETPSMAAVTLAKIPKTAPKRKWFNLFG